ncbi:MAG: hypothetical protein ABSC91_03075 [Candidatus Bathyarchaeia archaeon]
MEDKPEPEDWNSHYWNQTYKGKGSLKYAAKTTVRKEPGISEKQFER